MKGQEAEALKKSQRVDCRRPNIFIRENRRALIGNVKTA